MDWIFIKTRVLFTCGTIVGQEVGNSVNAPMFGGVGEGGLTLKKVDSYFIFSVGKLTSVCAACRIMYF